MTLRVPRLPITLDPLIAEAKRRMRLRRSLLALVLLLVAGAAAGGALALRPWGGGGNQAAVQQGAQRLLGNGHPHILQMETVRTLRGNQVVIATLHGHFTAEGPMPAGPCNERCQDTLRTPFSYAWLSFSPSQPEYADAQATTASQIAAIDNAHSARSVFGIFPNSTVMAILCAIPRGNASGTLAGHCTTSFLPISTSGSSTHVRAVRFRESWAFEPSHLGYDHQTKAGGWIVALDRNEHVQSIRRFGDLPPQLWK